MTENTESTAPDAGPTDRDTEPTGPDAESTGPETTAPGRDMEGKPRASGQSVAATHPPVAVPETATVVECGYCGQPFADEDLLALHRGLAHADDLGVTDREAFEDAYERESDRLRLFRLKALGIIVLLYFGLLMTYALVS